MLGTVLRNRVFSNTIWLVSERILSIFGLFIITSSVAKYIGPSNFGKINTAVLYFSIVQSLVVWGSDIIGVKLITRFPIYGINFLRSFTFFKVLFFSISSFFVFCYFYLEYDQLTFVFSLAVGFSSFFAILDYANTYNEATLKSNINVIANVIGLILSLVIRYIIVELKLDPKYLSFSILAQGFFPYIIRFFFFRINNKSYSFFYKPKIKHIKYGVFSGLGLVISSVSIMIYLNIGRVFLSDFDTMSSLGIYSVAMVLGTTWSFVNNAIIVSLTPMLYSSQKEVSAQVTSFLSMILIVIGLFYFSFFLLFGDYIITLLYGKEYEQAYYISLILIPVTTLSSLGIVAARYIISQGGYNFEAKKAFLTAIFTIFISWLLIRNFGMYGAAWGTLLCEILSLTIINYFYKRAEVFYIHVNIFDLKMNISILKAVLKDYSSR